MVPKRVPLEHIINANSQSYATHGERKSAFNLANISENILLILREQLDKSSVLMFYYTLVMHKDFLQYEGPG